MSVGEAQTVGWIALLLLTAALLAAVWFKAQRISPEPWQFLAQVEQFEKTVTDPQYVQTFGTMLAVLGRDDEVRQLDLHPQFDSPQSTVTAEDLNLSVVS